MRSFSAVLWSYFFATTIMLIPVLVVSVLARAGILDDACETHGAHLFAKQCAHRLEFGGFSHKTSSGADNIFIMPSRQRACSDAVNRRRRHREDTARLSDGENIYAFAATKTGLNGRLVGANCALGGAPDVVEHYFRQNEISRQAYMGRWYTRDMMGSRGTK